MNHFYCIGAGGVGSWLAPAICKLVGPKNVTIVDGDRLEKKNLDRQLFSADCIGQSKAHALAQKYGCSGDGRFYSHGLLDIDNNDWLLVGVDNHPARRSCLQTADVTGCQVVLGANEVTSSEAYYYRGEWQGTPLDPRIYYPEIATNNANDPRAAAIGCTGEAQEKNRQLVTANFLAAGLMQHLLVVWHLEARKLNTELLPELPFRLIQNLTGNQLIKVKDA